MTTPATHTQDPSQRDGWTAVRDLAARVPEPALRLLFHSDLARFGAITPAGAIPSSGAWVTVGRNAPGFVDPSGAENPIADPHVSREQLRIRWRPDARAFEVEPAPAARRPVRRVALDGSVTVPITAPTLLPPGTCLAIGDCALLGLELATPRSRETDRLGFVGESGPMWALREEIAAVAQFGRPALVTGPTGAGKELVARALHDRSARAAGPFVPVNCAALPANLVESVLFGHRKGAFTGAETEEKGLFRAADGGTLFLDEVGELPLPVQAKLLRVLQEGVVVPVGATSGKPVDVRVVAATHRNLAAQVVAGELREDLFHRLAAHPIVVPALAERRFDVPELFVHALSRLRGQHPSLAWLWGGAASFEPTIPIAFVAELLRRPWSGNVRELENVVERTARLNLVAGTFRVPEDLAPAEPPPSVVAPSVAVSEATVRAAADLLGIAQKTLLKLLPSEVLAGVRVTERPADEARAELRRRAVDALHKLLERHDFNQSVVAGELGTSRTTLIKLMDDLGLPRAAELGLAEIERARDAAGGDLDAAAKALRVAPAALRKRLTILKLKGG